MATPATPAAASSANGPLNIFSAKGLVALITGGGTGIGLMMAKALAEAGARRVYIVGRRREVLEEAAASIGLPSVVAPLYCDVTSKVSLASVADVVERDVGFLNLVVCNAGVGGPAAPPLVPGTTTLDEWRHQQLAVDADDWEHAFRVNCSAAWFTAMACLKLLDEGNKRGNVEQSSQVVVTGSIAAFNKRTPGGFAYGQSKAAATLMVKQLAVVLPTWNIRANCISPGLFPSEMSSPIVQRATESGLDWVEGQPIPLGREIVPLGRMGDGLDIAGAILYLASRAGAYCNGSVMLVDGGRLNTFPSTY